MAVLTRSRVLFVSAVHVLTFMQHMVASEQDWQGVLTVGGRGTHGDYANNAPPQIFNPDAVNGTMTNMAINWNMFSLQNPAAAVLNTGQVLVAGGKNDHYGPSDLVQMFDPVYNRTRIAAHLREKRAEHSATVMGDHVVVCGGLGAKGRSSTCEIYTYTPGGGDLVYNESWTLMTEMPSRRAGHSAVALDGKLFLVGGTLYPDEDDVIVFDPETGNWTAAAPRLEPRTAGQAAMAHGGRLIVCGGSPPGQSTPVKQCQIYDPNADLWTVAPPMAMPRRGHQMIMHNHRAFIVGGYDRWSRDRVETYDVRGGGPSRLLKDKLPMKADQFAAVSIVAPAGHLHLQPQEGADGSQAQGNYNAEIKLQGNVQSDFA